MNTMTSTSNLRVRRVRYDFAGDDVPFLWQPDRPLFSVKTNFMSFIAPGFENMIVEATREAIPLMTDPAAVEEANLYLRQEAQHSAAHVRHLNALIRRYPGLRETLDELYATYNHISRTKSLTWRLAYTAVLESAFTPYFKVFLDHEDKLFAAGDERVASMFLWHFCEEVEHRSSAMIVYRSVNDSYRYRLRALGSILRHISSTVSIVHRGFHRHVPAEEGGMYACLLPDGLSPIAIVKAKKAAKELLTPEQATYHGVPRRDLLAMIAGLIRVQAPNYDAKGEPLPAFADTFFRRYEEEPKSAARWYSVGVGAGAQR